MTTATTTLVQQMRTLDADRLRRYAEHLAFYGGWPVAMSAANVAKKVFEGGDKK